MNKVILIGNLTRDPEVKTGDSYVVGKFGLAVNRRFKDKEETTFFDVETWGKQAELAESYLSKGNKVLVEGRLKNETWDDKDGNKRSKMVVVAEHIEFLTPKDKSETKDKPEKPEKVAKKTKKEPEDTPEDDDSVPF